MMNRAQTLDQMARGPMDLLVIGGGIVGASVARDAAMRGLRTGLVEQQDFAFGTSGRSSRLLHGGMRYLAQGRIGLVQEASVEKTVLHRIAPHLAAPLPFVFPGYRGNRDWQLWQLKLGVKLYDLLCMGRNLGDSSWLSRAETLLRVPGLKADQLQGSVRYFDGLTNDARLVLDTLRSAVRHGALVLNACRYIKGNAGSLWTCECVDQLTSQPLLIQARAVVNATGPWADGLPHSGVRLRLTKGIHLVVDQQRLPVTETVVMTEGPRILFAIPWGQRTLLGTTDTDYDGSLDEVVATAQDVAYVLGIANTFFPQANLSEHDVISTWAGLRPLIADPKGKPSDISRSHEIKSPERHWWDVAGGKLTTCRLMAEQTVDRVVKDTGLSVSACKTADEALLPEADVWSGITPPEVSRESVQHYCEQEWALHLSDVMIRRTSWHYYHADAEAVARQVLDWMAELRAWDEETKAAEWTAYQRLLSLSTQGARRS